MKTFTVANMDDVEAVREWAKDHDCIGIDLTDEASDRGALLYGLSCALRSEELRTIHFLTDRAFAGASVILTLHRTPLLVVLHETTALNLKCRAVWALEQNDNIRFEVRVPDPGEEDRREMEELLRPFSERAKLHFVDTKAAQDTPAAGETASVDEPAGEPATRSRSSTPNQSHPTAESSGDETEEYVFEVVPRPRKRLVRELDKKKEKKRKIPRSDKGTIRTSTAVRVLCDLQAAG